MKDRRKNDKYNRILEAAIRIFAQKGFFQSRVSDIAREAGVADGTIYLYFRNKDDLLISIFEEKMREAIEIFQRKLAEFQDAESKFRKFVEVYLYLFENNPDLASVLQVELRQSARFMKEYKKVELKRFLDLIGQIIEQGQEEGVFRKEISPSIAKRFVFGALDEIVSTWVSRGCKGDLKSQAPHMVELFLQGFKCRQTKEDIS